VVLVIRPVETCVACKYPEWLNILQIILATRENGIKEISQKISISGYQKQRFVQSNSLLKGKC
jgi:hypothetical protein